MAGSTGEKAKDAVTGEAEDSVTGAAAPAPPEGDLGHPSPQTEWTASDRRGPLAAAPAGSDGGEHGDGRIVREGEADTAGVRDPLLPIGAPAGHEARPGTTPSVTGDAPGVGSGVEAEEVGVPHAAPASGEASAEGPEPAAAAAPAAAPPRRSPWPVAAGVVLGALIGAGSAALVYARAPGAAAPDDGKLAALSARVDALDGRPDLQPAVAALRHDLGDLAGKVAALGTRPPQAAAPPATPAPPAAAGQDVAALRDRLAALQVDVAGLKGQGGARDLAGQLDALKGRQQDLDGRFGALQATLGGVQKQAAAAQSGIDAVRGGIDAVRGEQKTLAGKVDGPAVAVAADSLVGQIEAGRPYAAEVDALAALGADPAKLAVLRQNAAAGVPSAQVLLVKFQPLADPMVATGSKAPAGAGFGERLKHGLLGLVSVRRADDAAAGDDLPSRVAVIQADLARGDVSGAYAAWSALPPDAKAKSEAWGALAKTRVDAMGAARALQTESIGSLAAKHS